MRRGTPNNLLKSNQWISLGFSRPLLENVHPQGAGNPMSRIFQVNLLRDFPRI